MKANVVYFTKRNARGRLDKVVAQYAGHVTVLRCNTRDDLPLFGQAVRFFSRGASLRSPIQLESVIGRNRVVSVGIGDDFSPEDTRTVATFLEDSGVRPEAVETLLDSCGLDRIAALSVKELGPPQARILSIMGAMVGPNGYVFMVDPFSEIPLGWHDTIGEYILRATAANGMIVGVFGALSLPGRWDDDSRVSRVLWEECSPERMFDEAAYITQQIPDWLAQELRTHILAHSVKHPGQGDSRELSGAAAAAAVPFSRMMIDSLEAASLVGVAGVVTFLVLLALTGRVGDVLRVFG